MSDLPGPVTGTTLYYEDAAAVAPIPIAPTPAPITPCDPQTQVSDGGKGGAGCNTGGVGFVSQLPAAPYGDVPSYTDPDDGETLTGKVAVDAWVEIDHADYPSGDVTTYRRGLAELADDASYYGGRKTEGLKTIGTVEHGLGNEQGGFESATVDIEYADVVDRLFRNLLVDQDIDGDEVRLLMATRARRAAGLSPRVLQRAIAQRTTLRNPLAVGLSASDILYSDFGPFGPDKRFPGIKIPAGAWLNMPPGVTDKVIATLYGEKSDEGATNPVTGVANPKGLIPLQFVGQEDLSGDSPTPPAWVEDAGITAIPTPLTITNATGAGGDITVTTKVYVAAVKGGLISILPDAGDVPPFDPLGVTEQDGVALAIHLYQQDPEVDYYIAWASDDMSFHPIDNPNAGNVGTATHDNTTHDGWSFSDPTPVTYDFTILIKTLNNKGRVRDGVWDAYLVHLGAGYQILNLYGSDLGGGVPTNKHDRVLIDTDARGGSDVLGPDWPNWPFAERYRDIVGADGNTYRLTMIYVRGPLSDDHKNGVVNMTVNAIGTEDIGDGTGLPIIEAEKIKQHVIENHLIPPEGYRTGLWVTTATGPTWEDGTSKVRSSSFEAVQAFLTTEVGGVGITYGWLQDEELDVVGELVPAWNRSTDTRMGVNGHGQIMDFVQDPLMDTSDWPHLTHVSHLFGEITRTSGEERENVVRGTCDWDPDASKFRIGQIGYDDTAAIAQYKGRQKKGSPIESKMLTVTAHLQNVLLRRLARLRIGVTSVEMTGPLGFLDYDVGTGLFLTTIEGTGETGYDDQPFLIVRRKTDLRSRKVTYTLLDLSNVLVTTGEMFAMTDDAVAAPLMTDVEDEAPILL